MQMRARAHTNAATYTNKSRCCLNANDSGSKAHKIRILNQVNYQVLWTEPTALIIGKKKFLPSSAAECHRIDKTNWNQIQGNFPLVPQVSLPIRSACQRSIWYHPYVLFMSDFTQTSRGIVVVIQKLGHKADRKVSGTWHMSVGKLSPFRLYCIHCESSVCGPLLLK